MKSLARSQAARRRAAAAAAIAGVGAGILGTQSAEAGIVTVNLGPTGFNITGDNGGTDDNIKIVNDFPKTGGGTLTLRRGNDYGVYGSNGLAIAINGGFSSPHNFASGVSIGSSFSGIWTNNSNFRSPLFYTYAVAASSPFGADSYLGFKTSQGNYGWLKATWNYRTTTYQLYSAAYESVVGASIKAGDTGSSPVPEIDPSGLASAMSLVMGSAAMLEQRRRKRAAVAAESAAVTA